MKRMFMVILEGIAFAVLLVGLLYLIGINKKPLEIEISKVEKEEKNISKDITSKNKLSSKEKNTDERDVKRSSGIVLSNSIFMVETKGGMKFVDVNKFEVVKDLPGYYYLGNVTEDNSFVVCNSSDYSRENEMFHLNGDTSNLDFIETWHNFARPYLNYERNSMNNYYSTEMARSVPLVNESELLILVSGKGQNKIILYNYLEKTCKIKDLNKYHNSKYTDFLLVGRIGKKVLYEGSNRNVTDYYVIDTDSLEIKCLLKGDSPKRLDRDILFVFCGKNGILKADINSGNYDKSEIKSYDPATAEILWSLELKGMLTGVYYDEDTSRIITVFYDEKRVCQNAVYQCGSDTRRPPELLGMFNTDGNALGKMGKVKGRLANKYYYVKYEDKVGGVTNPKTHVVDIKTMKEVEILPFHIWSSHCIKDNKVLLPYESKSITSNGRKSEVVSKCIIYDLDTKESVVFKMSDKGVLVDSTDVIEIDSKNGMLIYHRITEQPTVKKTIMLNSAITMFQFPEKFSGKLETRFLEK